MNLYSVTCSTDCGDLEYFITRGATQEDVEKEAELARRDSVFKWSASAELLIADIDELEWKAGLFDELVEALKAQRPDCDWESDAECEAAAKLRYAVLGKIEEMKVKTICELAANLIARNAVLAKLEEKP